MAAIITIADWTKIQEIIDNFDDCYATLEQHITPDVWERIRIYTPAVLESR